MIAPASLISISTSIVLCAFVFGVVSCHWPETFELACVFEICSVSILNKSLVVWDLIFTVPSCALDQEKSSIVRSKLGIVLGLTGLFEWEIFCITFEFGDPDSVFRLVESGMTAGIFRRFKRPLIKPLGDVVLEGCQCIWPVTCGELRRNCQTLFLLSPTKLRSFQALSNRVVFFIF